MPRIDRTTLDDYKQPILFWAATSSFDLYLIASEDELEEAIDL
jgi:hypothetical protein